MSYIFGGNTGVTPEQLDRKRRIAEALMAQNVAPRTAWDGLGNAARSISAALIERGAGKKEDAARQAAQGRFDALFAPQQGQTPQMPEAVSVPAPAAVRGGNEPMAYGNRQGNAAQPNEALVQAIIQQESGGNPNAVSPKGARGLMQIMPETARDPGFGVPDVFTMARQMGRDVPDTSDATAKALLADPQVNEAFGRAYFEAMGQRFPGDRAKQLAAYNAGPGAVEKYGGVPPYQETQDYVRSVESRPGGAQAGAQPAPVSPAPQQSGQPQGPDAIPTQALMQAYGDPFLAPEQREIIGMMLQQRMQQPEGMTAYQQEQIRLREQEMQMRAGGQWSPGTNVTVNNAGGPEVGTIPQGYQLTRDGETFRMEPIPGGPADRDVKQEDGKSLRQAQQMLDVIAGIEADPQLGNALGFASFLPDIPGYNTSPRARLDQLQGQAFLQAFESLKGGGQITEVEGTKATQAMARLKHSQTMEEYQSALADMKSVVGEVVTRLSGGQQGAPAEQPANDAAPQPGQVIDGYRFKGGDPADPNSWERM